MTLRDQLLQQALALPTPDQAFLAQSIEDHLIAHAEPEIEESEGVAGQELSAELQRRSAKYRSGQTQARPAADVLKDLRQRQDAERAN